MPRETDNQEAAGWEETVRNGRSERRDAGQQMMHADANLRISGNRTIDFVIDYSASMEAMLPMVYIFIQELLVSGSFGTGQSRFGVTLFSDRVRGKQWNQNHNFTTELMGVLDALLAGEIGGGAEGGWEDVSSAVEYSLEKLKAVPANERVMILFTDSKPKEMNLYSFRDKEALRAAVLFVPIQESASMYQFSMVDENGHPEKEKSPVIFDINEVVRTCYLRQQTEHGAHLLRNQLLLALS